MTYRITENPRIPILIRELIDNNLSEYLEQVSEDEVNLTMPPDRTNQYNTILDIVDGCIGFQNLVPIKS